MLKTLKRTVRLESDSLNKWKYHVLREIEEYQRNIVNEMIGIILSEGLPTTRKKLHERFYSYYKEKYPFLPSRVIEGSYIIAGRIVKSFRERRKKGLTRKEKPEYKKVVITIPNTVNWKFNKVSVSVLTHKGWVEIPLKFTKQFIHYLYEGWRVSQELKLRLVGRRVLVWLTFEKDVEVETKEGNYVSIDVNENNITLAVFEGFKLKEMRRYETGLGRIVINYSLRREEVTKGYSTKDELIKKKLKRLRERERKLDVLRKTVKRVVELARDLKVKVVVGKFSSKAKERMGGNKNGKLRHRIHQWSVVKFIEMLKAQPIDVEEVSESYTSSINPFDGERLGKSKQVVEKVIKVFNPYLMTGSAHEGRGIKVIKVTARYLDGGEILLERDSIAPLNLMKKVDGRVVVFPSTNPKDLRVTVYDPLRGVPLVELEVIKSKDKLRHG
ncbi:IS200/IS605 family element transposase accessory protein TnpB [Sulfurisphaera ohwakuensis]|uniref:IS200/IS605 family element transposase accessory protein TnpB n=3 Tax=Sulfurisphaera ohwakuensis TaxID=69656 RepID=A0A650CIF5_SULOH|nr:IS200/IS605 family accessory protein TnpB-related protein [Sulfurisphaera ohwakuensis]QGR17317.1 IS200/IS605 family element transposase accessory protein TnpB [Sulfurisphaera ohwakuensis]